MKSTVRGVRARLSPDCCHPLWDTRAPGLSDLCQSCRAKVLTAEKPEVDPLVPRVTL